MTKLIISFAAVVIIACSACVKPYEGTPVDLRAYAFAYTNLPIFGTPIENVPFVITFTDCNHNTVITKPQVTLFSNKTGRIDTIFKVTAFLTSDINCQPTIDIKPLTPSKFMRWGSDLNNNFEFREKCVLNLQINSDSTSVNNLRVLATQNSQSSNGFGLSNVQNFATNRARFRLSATVDIAKGEDTQLNFSFDGKSVRLETIKGSQLDTIFRLITL